MSSTVNGDSSSKAPALEADQSIGFQPQAKMDVQPPRKEDLQRSYATVVATDVNPQGWYGTMSEYILSSAGSSWHVCYVSTINPG